MTVILAVRELGLDSQLRFHFTQGQGVHQLFPFHRHFVLHVGFRLLFLFRCYLEVGKGLGVILIVVLILCEIIVGGPV